MVEKKSPEYEEDPFLSFKDLMNKIKSIEKPKGIEWIDYLITIQLVAFIIWSLNNNPHQYELVIVYFSAVAFISYWLIRVVFNPALNQKSIAT